MKKLRALCVVAQSFEDAGEAEIAQLIDTGISFLTGDAVTPADFSLREASDSIESELINFLAIYPSAKDQKEGLAVVASTASLSASRLKERMTAFVDKIGKEDLNLKELATVIALSEAFEVLQNENS